MKKEKQLHLNLLKIIITLSIITIQPIFSTNQIKITKNIDEIITNHIDDYHCIKKNISNLSKMNKTITTYEMLNFPNHSEFLNTNSLINSVYKIIEVKLFINIVKKFLKN